MLSHFFENTDFFWVFFFVFKIIIMLFTHNYHQIKHTNDKNMFFFQCKNKNYRVQIASKIWGHFVSLGSYCHLPKKITRGHIVKGS